MCKNKVVEPLQPPRRTKLFTSHWLRGLDHPQFFCTCFNASVWLPTWLPKCFMQQPGPPPCLIVAVSHPFAVSNGFCRNERLSHSVYSRVAIEQLVSQILRVCCQRGLSPDRSSIADIGFQGRPHGVTLRLRSLSGSLEVNLSFFFCLKNDRHTLLSCPR